MGKFRPNLKLLKEKIFLVIIPTIVMTYFIGKMYLEAKAERTPASVSKVKKPER